VQYLKVSDIRECASHLVDLWKTEHEKEIKIALLNIYSEIHKEKVALTKPPDIKFPRNLKNGSSKKKTPKKDSKTPRNKRICPKKV
jgi:hypothetical protein